MLGRVWGVRRRRACWSKRKSSPEAGASAAAPTMPHLMSLTYAAERSARSPAAARAIAALWAPVVAMMMPQLWPP